MYVHVYTRARWSGFHWQMYDIIVNYDIIVIKKNYDIIVVKKL